MSCLSSLKISGLKNHTENKKSKIYPNTEISISFRTLESLGKSLFFKMKSKSGIIKAKQDTIHFLKSKMWVINKRTNGESAIVANK